MGLAYQLDDSSTELGKRPQTRPSPCYSEAFMEFRLDFLVDGHLFRCNSLHLLTTMGGKGDGSHGSHMGNGWSWRCQRSIGVKFLNGSYSGVFDGSFTCHVCQKLD